MFGQFVDEKVDKWLISALTFLKIWQNHLIIYFVKAQSFFLQTPLSFF